MARGLGFDACPLSLRLWATAPTCRGERLRHKPPQDESQAAGLLKNKHHALTKPSRLSGTGGTGSSRTCSGSLAYRRRRHRRALLEQARSREDSHPFATSIEQLAVTGALTQPGPPMPSPPIHERRGYLPRRSGNTNDLTSDPLETQAPSKTAHLKVTPVVSPCRVELAATPHCTILIVNGGEKMCKLHLPASRPGSRLEPSTELNLSLN